MYEVYNSQKYDVVRYCQVRDILIGFFCEYCDSQLEDSYEVLRGDKGLIRGMEFRYFFIFYFYVMNGSIGFWVGDLQSLSYFVLKGFLDVCFYVKLCNWVFRFYRVIKISYICSKWSKIFIEGII